MDADIAGYARVADRLRSPTYSLVPLWRGMRAALDGDLDAGSRYADEVATLAGKAQSANAGMMAWTLRWRIARLHHDSRAMGELAGQIAEPAESTPDGIAPSHCSSRSRGIPSGGDDTCAG